MIQPTPVRFACAAALVVLLTASAAAGVAGASGASGARAAPVMLPGAAVRVDPPDNYCLGGIEDRKIIVDESRLSDPFHETARLGCEVDGGDPHSMPDLPAHSREWTRMA